MEKLNILIFGAGAIGTYIGGSLALSGQRVTFIEQPKVAGELLESGLRLDLTVDRRRHTTQPLSVLHKPGAVDFVPSLAEALSNSTFDIAIFALKSFDTPTSVEGMKPFADQLPPILCLSNGVDNEPVLFSVVGPDKVIAGTVTSSVARRGTGDIILERLRGVGVTDGHPLSLWLATALDEAGLNAHLYPHAVDMKWSKMLTNLLVNASVAILDMPPRQVLSHPGLFRLEIAMLREALAVMKARGIRVVDTPKTPVRLLALAAYLPAFLSRPLMVKTVGGGRGGKMPSFHIDLYAGRGRSEVEWLNGAVARYGEKSKMASPVNHALTDTLLSLTTGEIPLAEFAHQPEKLLAFIASKSGARHKGQSTEMQSFGEPHEQ